MEQKHESFSYTYSAKEQAEVQSIRDKYLPREDKLEQLRRLDRIPQRKAEAYALCLGVIGTLLLGLGMSLIMTELAAILGSLEPYAMVIGIAVGTVGLALASAAYPAYNRILKREQERIAPEILRLTDELI